MATTLSQIYTEVCSVLLEPGGLTLGLVSFTDFVRFAGEVLTDFMTKTGIQKKVVCLPVQAGTDTYTQPDSITDTQYAAFNQSYIHRTSAFYLDNSDAIWTGEIGDPDTWKQDEVDPKQLQVNPIPQFDGDQVFVAFGQGWYGTFSSVTAGTLDIQASTSFYGTIGSFSGPTYFETTVPFFGVVASMVVSSGNLETICTAIPSTLNLTYTAGTALTTSLELIPDSFTPAIKYGILERIFSQDGECKDMIKAQYCATRYAEFINLASAIMDEVFEQE